MKRADLVTRICPTRLGPLLVAATRSGLAYLGLEGDLSRAALDRWRAETHPGASMARARHGELDEVATQLAEYARKERRRFELPLDLVGTAFQRVVWSELTQIPFGQTRSYGQVAQSLGRPGSARALGQANGANPIPLIVPCHRVVGSSGLGGYSGGLCWKRRLLAHEGLFAPALA